MNGYGMLAWQGKHATRKWRNCQKPDSTPARAHSGQGLGSVAMEYSTDLELQYS